MSTRYLNSSAVPLKYLRMHLVIIKPGPLVAPRSTLGKIFSSRSRSQGIKADLTELMSRVLVLLALHDLDADSRRRIFFRVFPTKAEIEARLKTQHKGVKDTSKLDDDLMEFVHGNGRCLELQGLTRAERKWVHLRCELFGLDHFSRDIDNGRVLIVSKGIGWAYDRDKAVTPIEWGSYPKRSRRIRFWYCEECGEGADDQDFLRYYHKNLGIHMCEECRYGVYGDE